MCKKKGFCNNHTNSFVEWSVIFCFCSSEIKSIQLDRIRDVCEFNELKNRQKK